MIKFHICEMSIFFERFQTLCQQKRISVYNYGKSTVNRWANNTIPNGDTLIKISKDLNCSVDYLLGLTDVKDIIKSDNLKTNIPKEYQYIIDNYQSLHPHDKEIVDYIFNMKQEESIKLYYFPIFYQSAAAGIGRLSETDDYQMEELQIQNIPKEAKFGMYIEGHSMETIIYEHDIVLIDPSENNPNNLDDKIVVSRFGNELICKKLSVNEDKQTYDFESENQQDKDKGRFNQKQSDFTLIGQVVKIIHAHEIGNGIFTYSEDE